MKRLIAAIAAVGMSIALFAGCGTAALAQQSAGTQSEQTSTAAESVTEPLSIDLPATGLSLKLAEKYNNLSGYFAPYDTGETDFNSGVYKAVVMYVARTEDERIKMESEMDDKSVEELRELSHAYMENHAARIFSFYAIKEDMDVKTVLTDMGVDPETLSFTEIGHENGLKYYFVPCEKNDTLEGNIPEEMYTEYMSLLSDGQDAVSEYTFKDPKATVEVAEAGTKISFETTDLDGNTVKSDDLFKGHKVTMINIWATNGNPCKNELADLEEYNKKISDMGCQVIGICDDTLNNEETAAEAKAILKEHGVTYTNLVQTDELSGLLEVAAYPTTYFVGSDGTVLTMPVKTTEMAQYDERLQEALEAID